MTVGAIYVHFPSKDRLLVAVYEEGVRRIGEAVDAVPRAGRPVGAAGGGGTGPSRSAARQRRLRARDRAGDPDRRARGRAAICAGCAMATKPASAGSSTRSISHPASTGPCCACCCSARSMPRRPGTGGARAAPMHAPSRASSWPRCALAPPAKGERHEPARRNAHPPKVLVTKIGLDGHDRGSRVVAAFLRDAGMEVLYTPPWQEIAQVVRLAEEEDVDVIGISSLATDHLLVPKLMKALKKAGLADVPVDRRRHRAGRGREEAQEGRRGARVPPGRLAGGDRVRSWPRSPRKRGPPRRRRCWHDQACESRRCCPRPCLCRCPTTRRRARPGGQRCRRDSAASPTPRTAPASRSSRSTRRKTHGRRRATWTRSAFPASCP